MKKAVIICLAAAFIVAGSPPASAEGSRCDAKDRVCKELEALSEAEQFETIAGKVNRSEKYSEGSRGYIGKAYLALAANETNTPEQEEAFCRKALEFGATQAYMGLYFINVQKNEEDALGYLREYVKTKPSDSVPYVLLGESELEKKNYHLADEYLREAKRISRANSPRVDWMLFQANYLLGNYQYASELLGSALKNGKFQQELKTLASDARFHGIAKRPEFRNIIPG